MITPYLISFTVSLVLIAVWHGVQWRNAGYVASIHKAAANTIKGFIWANNAILYYQSYPFTWSHVFPAMVAAFVFQACVWWLLFDRLVNIAGGRKLFYKGGTAFTDRLFADIFLHVAAQLVAVAVSGVLLLVADSLVMQ